MRVRPAPYRHQGRQLLLRKPHIQSPHRNQRPRSPAVPQAKLRDLPLLPQRGTLRHFLHRHMEHSGRRSLINLPVGRKHIQPPPLPRKPRQHPRLNRRKIRHHKPAPRLRHKRRPYQLRKHLRRGTVKHLHILKPPLPHKPPRQLQIRQMVLREILHLHQPPRPPPGPVRPVKLQQTMHPPVRTHRPLHGLILLHGSLRHQKPQPQKLLHLPVRPLDQLRHRPLGQALRLHPVLPQPALQLRHGIGILQSGKLIRPFRRNPLMQTLTPHRLPHQPHIHQHAPVIDPLVQPVRLHLPLRYRELPQLPPYGLLHIHVPPAVTLEHLPLLRRMARQIPPPAPVGLRRLTRHTEIPYQLLPLLHLPLIQPQHRPHVLQRPGQRQHSRLDRAAVPRIRRKIPPEILRKTRPLKIRIERRLHHRTVKNRLHNILRQHLPLRQIYHPGLPTVKTIGKQQDFKSRAVRISVNPALYQIHITERLNINP